MQSTVQDFMLKVFPYQYLARRHYVPKHSFLKFC